jgi:Aspartyl protease
MTLTSFDRTRDLIYIRGRVWGPRGNPARLRLALDTAASETVIVPGILDEIGYSPRQGSAITKVRSAVAEEPGYLIRVAQFACLGFQMTEFRVHALDLPDGFELDGLLGLTFLKQFDYQVRSLQGRILVEHAQE